MIVSILHTILGNTILISGISILGIWAILGAVRGDIIDIIRLTTGIITTIITAHIMAITEAIIPLTTADIMAIITTHIMVATTEITLITAITIV